MKDWLDVFGVIRGVLGLPETPWLAIVALLLYFSRGKLEALWGRALDRFGTAVGGRWSNRRFETPYRRHVHADHLRLKVVGVRTEEARRPTIADAYVPIRLLARDAAIEHHTSVENAVQDQKYVLILGDPGAGKSTILDYLVCRHTEPVARPRLAMRLLTFLLPFPSRLEDVFPIYVPLRRCVDSHQTLLDDILDEGTKILPTVVRRQMPKRFIEQSLASGSAILLLDGLDEVSSEEAYRSVAKKINDAKALWPCRIVVTCRKAGWRGSLDQDFRGFSALPLDTQQQYEFVHKWYAAILRYKADGMSRPLEEISAHAAREADKLIALIGLKERLREVASNPLLLSLICLVHHRKKDLPRGRAALYEECVEILVDLWDRVDKDLDQRFPSTDQKKSLLRRIAHHMHTTGIREIRRPELEELALRFLPAAKTKEAAADVIRQLEVRSGLMAERSIDVLTFSHLTFQEFLVVDYFEREVGAELRLDRITDWSTWREPILLMCGTGRDPRSRVQQLFELQPVLAMEAIAEVDSQFVDEDIQALVRRAIERFEAGTIDAGPFIPALVSLLSVEGNPFGHRILAFLLAAAERSPDEYEYYRNLVEVLSRTPTQEAARILLLLIANQMLVERDLARPQLQDIRESLLAGLARFGDAAAYEALDWAQRGQIGDDLLFEVLTHVLAPAATQALWRRYGLEPSSAMELQWADAWARRLSVPENVRLVREIALKRAGVSNAEIWPYRFGDASALAAIVEKAVAILSKQYPTHVELLARIEVISEYSLLIQTPLLARPYSATDPMRRRDSHVLAQRLAPDAEHEAQAQYRSRILVARHLALDDSPVRSVFGSDGIVESFKPHAWKSLGGFLARHQEKRATTARKVIARAGIALELIAVVAVTLGIRSSLPPNGTYGAFVVSFPLWVAVVVVVAIAWYLALIYFGAIKGHGSLTNKKDVLAVGIVSILLIAVLIFIPALACFAYLWASGREVVERSLTFKKIPWGTLSYVLVLVLAVGILGSFAIVDRFVFPPPPQYVAGIIAAAVLGIALQCGARAFESNPLLEWLRHHPRGGEVLREFGATDALSLAPPVAPASDPSEVVTLGR